MPMRMDTARSSLELRSRRFHPILPRRLTRTMLPCARRRRGLWLLPLLCYGTSSAAPLQHRFYALRHGQSLANVQGVISSDPSVATLEHGLSARGWEEAEAAALTVVREARTACSGIVVCCSDFKRAHQTANAVHACALAAGVRVWPAEGVLVDTALRERHFGEFDGQSDENYARVWAEDALDGAHTIFGVESASDVRTRALAVVDRLNADPGLAEQSWCAAGRSAPTAPLLAHRVC